MAYMPLRGLYHNLSAWDSLVFWPGPEGLIYINSRVSRHILLDCFSLPCSIGLDFSFICKEFDLRVNGSFHGCIDFPLVARVIFVSFSSYFHLFFMCGLFLQFRGVWVRIFWWGSWIVASCIFVLDHDPSNSKFDLRLKDFGWKPSFVLEHGKILIPLDSVGLWLHICRYSIS
jgi:hypothetical protein